MAEYVNDQEKRRKTFQRLAALGSASTSRATDDTTDHTYSKEKRQNTFKKLADLATKSDSTAYHEEKQKRINEILQGAQSYFQSFQRKMDYMSRSNAERINDEVAGDTQRMLGEHDEIKQYLDTYGDRLDKDTYDALQQSLKWMNQARIQAADAASGKSKFLLSYDNDEDAANAWNTEIKNAENLGKYGDLSYDQIRDKLYIMPKDSEDYAWLEAYAPTVMTAKDAEKELARLQQERSTHVDTEFDWTDANARNAYDSKLAELDAQIEKAEKNKWDLENKEKYRALSSNSDFAELSKADIENYAADYTYHFINDANTRHMAYAQGMNGGAPLEMRKGYDELEPEEVSIFNYLYHKEGEKAAREYLNTLENELSARKQQANAQQWQKVGQEYGFLADAISVGGSLMGGAGYIDILGQKIEKGIKEAVTGEYAGPIDYNSTAQTPSVISSAIRGERSAQWAKDSADILNAMHIQNENGVIAFDTEDHPVLSKLFNGRSMGDVYQLGMSMVDSYVSAKLAPFIGTAGSTMLLAGNAATQTTLDKASQGATDGQALTMGLLAGAFEYIFEKYEIENLLGADTNVLRKMGNQAITEGLGEGATSFANTVADVLVMAEQSDLSKAAAVYMLQNPEWSESQAWKQALLDTAIDIGWDMVGGAFTGGIMGGTESVLQNIAIKLDETTQYRNIGKEIIGNTESVERLTALANELDGISTYDLGEQAQSVSKKATSKNVGRLLSDINSTINEQNSKDLSARLQEKGITADRANAIANAVVAARSDSTSLTQEQTSLLEQVSKDTAVTEAVSEILDTEGSAAYQRSEQLRAALTEISAPAAQADGTDADTSVSPLTKLARQTVEDQYAAEDAVAEDLGIQSAEGKILLEGNAVQIADVETAGNGKVTVKLTDGRSVDASALEFPDTGEAELWRVVGKYAEDAASARALLEEYRGGNLDAYKYARGVEEAFLYGKLNISPKQMEMEGSYVNLLNPMQRNMAYQQGIIAGNRQAQQRQKKLQAAKQGGNNKKGKLHFEGDRGKLTERQKVSLQSCEIIAKALGIQVYVFESKRGASGKRIGDNGWYDPKDGSIHIDLYAGQNGEGVMVFTLAHELTHFIKDWSPAKYRTLAGFLAEQYAKKGENVDLLVRRQQQKAEADGRKLSYEQAHEEWVADSMERMLTDGTIMEKLSLLQAKDASMVEKIKSFLDKFVKRLKAAYEGVDHQSVEGEIVGDMVDAAKELQNLFADALLDAGNNFRSAEKNTTGEGGVDVNKHSIREGMTDQERYEDLQHKQITIVTDTKTADYSADIASLETLETKAKSKAEKIIKPLAKKLGILNTSLSTTDVETTFLFTIGGGLAESMHKQLRYGGNYIDFAKTLINLDHVLESAVLIEVHGDKYAGTTRANEHLEAVYVLFGAFQDGANIIPVQMEIKKSSDVGGRLYLTVAMTKIEAGVVGSTPGTIQAHSLLPASKYNLADIFSKINPQDGHFLKYLPDGFLNKEQKKAKKKALEEDETRIARYRITKEENSTEKRSSARGGDAATNREMLVDLFEQMVTDSNEYKALQNYKKHINEMLALEEKLERLSEEIKRVSFSEGPRDMEYLNNLKWQQKETVKQLNRFDNQLLQLEKSGVLRAMIERNRKIITQQSYDKAREYYRQKNETREAEIRQYYRESRRQAVERHDKAQVRQQIKKDVARLDSLLNKGTKEKNVKLELKDFAGAALRTAKGAFLNNYSEYDMIRNGVGVTMDREKKAVFARCKELLAELDQIREMKDAEPAPDNLHQKWDPEATLRKDDREEALKKELAKNMRVLREAGIFRTENELLEDSNADQLMDELMAAYTTLKDSDQAHIRGVFSEAIYGQMEKIKEFLAGKVIKDMTAIELAELHKMYRMVLHTVTHSNDLFAQKRKADVRKLGEEVITQLQSPGKEMTPEILDTLKKMGWANLKPETALELIGSDTLTEMMQGLYRGEDTYALDIEHARVFAEEQGKKFGRKNWNMDKTVSFAGTKITLGQAMSLYAYTKRKQAQGHLEGEGFTHSANVRIEAALGKLPIKLKWIVNPTKTHKVTREMYDQVAKLLTPEQKKYADAMQEYLSKVMGAKGNEVSMKLYGINLFEEKAYFPLKTAQEFHEEALGATTGEAKRKNSGFSKPTQENASNPIVLDSFENVWAKHVDDMSLYHGFVLPMEDFDRVYNYHRAVEQNVTNSFDEIVGTKMVDTNETVKVDIENKIGKAANDYIENFMKQLNGGVRSDATEKLFNGLRNFKKTAVLGSLSVAVQQPTAFIRAMAYLDMKDIADWKNWLGKTGKPEGRLVAEMYKYAPVALMKHIGGFDPGLGRTTKEYVFNDKAGVKETLDKYLGMLPEKMDEWTWTYIWVCTKRQIHRQNPSLRVGSEEFLQKAGERFSKIIRDTQVYDSVLTKSQIMRSKNVFLQMATSFMNEPTTSLDMYIRSTIQVKRGKISKKKAARTYAAVVGSQLLCSAVAAFVYAIRDDDEDETYWEKYVSALVGKSWENVMPFYSIPFVKDIFSIFEGYSVERSDMSLITDLYQGWKKLQSGNASPWEKAEAFAGSILNVFGIPLKNVSRDVRGIYNTVATWINSGVKGTRAGMKYAALEGLTGKKPSKEVQLQNAVAENDAEHILRVLATYSDESDAFSNFRTAVKENYQLGELSEDQAKEFLRTYTGINAEDAQEYLTKWRFAMENPDTVLENSQFLKYTEFAEPAGISQEIYAQYAAEIKACESETDEDGKTVVSRQEKVWAVINSLPISKKQKDALHYASGYKESSLEDAPWN